MRYLLFAALVFSGPLHGQETPFEDGLLLYRINENGQRYGEPGQIVRHRVIDTERGSIEVEIGDEYITTRRDYAVIPLDPAYAPSRVFLLLKGSYPGDPGTASYYADRYMLARDVVAAFPGHRLADELRFLSCEATAELEAFQSDGKNRDLALACYQEYLGQFAAGAHRDYARWEVERPRTYEYEGYVGPMIEHVREHEALLARFDDDAVRTEIRLAMGHLLLRAFDAWHDADDDVERGGFDGDDSIAFLTEARDVYGELLRSDDVETRELARVRLWEIDRREATVQPVEPMAAGSAWSGFGEGFSSPADGGPVQISVRAHTTPSLTEWIRTGVVVDRLLVTPQAIEARVGEPLDLGQLHVDAFGPDGQSVYGIPLSFSVASANVLFDYEGFRANGSDILAIRSGEATIRVESLLPSSNGKPVRQAIAVTIH